MHRQIQLRIAIFLFVLINIVFAQNQDTTGVTFPIQYNWLQNRYTPIDIFQRKGLNLVSENYAASNKGLFDLKLQGLKEETYVDSSGNTIYFSTKLDNRDLYWPVAMDLQEYYNRKKYTNMRENIRLMGIENTRKAASTGGNRSLELIGADIAGQKVALRVSGNINISGQLNNRQRSMVATNIQDGKSSDFKIDQKMRFNIEGTIGDRISILVDQDSERSFDFENNMRIHYTGKEDEIVQNVSAGNISLALPGTKYVTFSSKNSGLFGIKADMKFGPINLTTIASVEKGEKQKMSWEGGAQKTEIDIPEYQYVRDKYFYLDKEFRARHWEGFIETGLFQPNNEVVRQLEVYKSVDYESASSVEGVAYVDPNNPEEFESDNKTGYFERLEEGVDYSYSADFGFIQMHKTFQNEVLAAVYTVRDKQSDNIIRAYGDWNRDPRDTTATDVSLKLIKTNVVADGSHPTWDLMWRNVYDLQASQIDSTGFDLEIMYDGATGLEPRDQDDGETFLKKFSLDIRDASGAPGQDDMVDLGTGLVRLSTGELIFPYLKPFEYDPSEGGEGNPNIEGYNNEIMYEKNLRTSQDDIVGETKFVIRVKYENRSSMIQLPPMLMEGSEEITLNGQKLVKGTDYEINYFDGMLNIYREEATKPDAKLDIKYEKNSFFQLKKKTILGARAEYAFGPDKQNFIGATGLYYSKSVVDDKVEIGYEPMANFVFDINGRYQKDLTFLTKALDRLPLVDTDKQSSFKVEGEIARVLPNPNTSNNKETGDHDGVAYVDDFEGSKRTISPVLTKNFWSKSAPPVEKSEHTKFNQNFMGGHVFWYVDYDGIMLTDIWPQKDLGRNKQDRRTSPLYMTLEPEAAPGVGVDAPNSLKEEAWGGISYFFPVSSTKQSKTKFIDIWMKPSDNVGKLHLDIGTISEDQIPDRKLNTEDVYQDYANNRYDPGEDIGLDGLKNEDEFLIVRDFNSMVYDTLYYGDDRLKEYRRNPKDPSLDDFNYRAGTYDYKYLRTVNGTEGNKKDGATNGRPDTENRNDNPTIDLANNYRSVEIDLSESMVENVYFEDETEFDNGEKTGWRLYRIPLVAFKNRHPDVFNDESFSFQYVEALRLWMDGVSEEQATIAIAKIEMVRNEWEANGIANSYDNGVFLEPDTNSYVPQGKTFATTVKNTEENTDYEPPKGVEGEYDKVNEVQRKEQSLVLKIYDEVEGSQGLKPGQIASAEKDVLDAQGLSLINYKRLKMFVHGNVENYMEGEKTPLHYFMRFGKAGNSPQFFEIRKPIYGGWDKRNHLNVDMDFMTSLKKYDMETYETKNSQGLQEFWLFDDETYGTIRVYKEVKDGAYTGKEIIIYGTPSISRIKLMETGLINMGDETVFGEVWLDELRVSEVRKNAGTAARASFSLDMADIASINFNTSRRDADFHNVEQQPSSQASSLNNRLDYSTSARLNLHKFLPARWGLSIPVTSTVNYSEDKPKYLPGTDILAGETPPDSVITQNQGYGINTSISKRASDFWLTKYTVDQLSLKFSVKQSENSNVDIKNREDKQYTTGLTYNIPFGRDNYIQILKWAENIPIIGPNYSDMKLYYTPDKFSYNFNTSEKKNLKIPRNVKSDTTRTHIMRMKQSINFGYKMTDNIKMGYTRGMENNLDEIADEKWEYFKQFRFGTNETVQEKYDFTFNPQLFSWLKPNFSYSSQYSWSDPVASPSVYLDKLMNNNMLSASTSLNIAQVFKSFYAGGGKSKTASTSGRSSRSSRRGSPRNSRGRNQTADNEEEAPKAKEGHPILDGIHKYLNKLQPIQLSYSVQNSVQNDFREVGHAGLDYRLGLSQDPGLAVLDTLQSAVNVYQDKKSITARSGLDIMKNIKTSFNYGYATSSSLNQGVETETVSEDYIPMGDKGDEGLPFPNWTVRVSGLEKIPFVDKFFQSLSLDHSFTGKKDENYKDGELRTSNYRMGFSPLVAVDMRFKKDINSNFRVNTSKSIRNQDGGMSQEEQISFSFDLNYKHRGGITIPLPFMENKRFDNNIDFTMAFEYNDSKSKNKQVDMKKLVVDNESSNISIKPRIGYSFSDKVTGGVFIQYQINNNNTTGERKNLNYGFDVNIAIRG
ncbi:MAG: cell surface protein SprA [Fidelibacterota bacterium]